MLIASLISFLAVQAIVTQHHVQHGIGDPGALRTVVGAALFLTVLGGAVRRHRRHPAQHGRRHRHVRRRCCSCSPGSARSSPRSVNDSISPYLPLNAGDDDRVAHGSTTPTT